MSELSAWLAARTTLDAKPNASAELFAAERMRALGLPTMAQYVDRLERDPQEATALHQHIAPPETWLFRYLASFEVLRESLQAQPPQRMVRIASLGCATGSEPFSIAATALACGRSAERTRILALDYSEEHLAVVRRGRVSPLAQRSPIPAWAARWFHPTQGGELELDRSGAAMIDAVRADLADWKPGAPHDFVFCRNVAIYLNASARRRLRDLLMEMTAPGGLIFLGHADAAIMDGAGAQRLDAEHAFAYRRMPEVSAPAPRPAAPSLPRRPPPPRAAPVAATPPAPPLAANAAAGALDEDLLATAQAAADEGDLDAARRSLRAHLARHPQDPKAHALDGCIELSRNDHAQAERSFTKVVYLEPSNALALLSLAALADRRGDAGAAQRFRERASRSGTEAIRE